MIDHQEMKNDDVPLSVLGANNVFLIGIIGLLGLNIITRQFFAGDKGAAQEHFNAIALVTEFIFILLPAYLYVLFSGRKVRRVLRLNRLSLGNLVLSVLAVICAYPGIIFINYILHVFIDKIGRPVPAPVFDVSSFPKLLMGIAVIAGSAGICEEVMFRGVIMRSYEKYGKMAALLISSALFSIMHMDVQKIVPIFALALLIGYLVQKTNSIFAGMVAHFINNSISVVVMYVFGFVAKAQGISLEELMEKQQTMQVPDSAYIIGGGVLFFAAVVFGAALAGILMLLKENNRNLQHDEAMVMKADKSEIPFTYFAPLLPGIALIGVKLAQELYYILSMPVPPWLKVF